MHILTMLLNWGGNALWFFSMIAAAAGGFFLTKLARKPGLEKLKMAGFALVGWALLTILGAVVWKIVTTIFQMDVIPPGFIPATAGLIRGIGSVIDLACMGAFAFFVLGSSKPE